MAKGILVLFLLLATASFGSESKKILETIRENYASMTSCRSEIQYRIYRGFDSDTPVGEYGGRFFRDGGNTFRRIDQSDFINLEKEGVFIRIDHANREMTLSNAVQEQLFDTDLKSSLKYCSQVIANETGNGLLIILYLNKKTHTLPYTRMDLEVDDKYLVRSITLYYSAKVNFSKDFNRPDYDRVKMKISYVDFDPAWKAEKERFDAARYLTPSGDTYVPCELYKNYTIVDLRK